MRTLYASLAVLALATGCAGPKVHYDYDARATYAGYRAWDWYAAPKGGGGANPIADARVRRAVEAELTAKGFRREPAADPDFLVIYQAAYGPRRKGARGHVSVGLGMVPVRGLGLGVGVAAPVSGGHRGKIGSIILEIKDFKSQQVIWRAEAEEVLDDSLTPEESDQDVAKAVTAMLAKFPPPTAR